MAEPFIGEIRIFAFPFVPKGWAACDGQIMSINQNQALFALLGTTYGGNGITTFALPDLRGRVPVHFGNGVSLGQMAGESAHTLTSNEMPAHIHGVIGSAAVATKSDPTDQLWAAPAVSAYATAPNTVMAANALKTTGGSQPHENMQPYLTVMCCIALNGIFPSRS